MLPAFSAVLASNNAKKLKELHALLGLELQAVGTFSSIEPEETGATFIENALIKARHAARVSGLPAIADDSGLVVPRLNGMPGVISARYAGVQDKSQQDAANNALLLHNLLGVEDRRAYFVCVLVYLRHAEDPLPIIAQGLWQGQILHAAQGAQGFGYDPLFLPDGLQLSSAQLAPEVKNQISHRALAAAALKAQL
jgi:XTP/dITP diphosphohydrolase